MTSDIEQAFELKEIQGNPDLNRYLAELRDDMHLTKMNLGEKSRSVSSIRTKWLNYYYLEKNNLKRIKAKKDEIVRGKLGNGVGKSVLQVKNVDKISQEDETIRKLDALAECVKTNIDFLEHAMNILGDFGFTVKNSIEVMKMEMM